MAFDNTPKTSIPRLTGPQNWHGHYEAVLNWCLLNPHRNDSEGARELNLTHPWFSQIVNSDMFKDRLRERASEMGIELGFTARGIYAKMIQAADLAMEETIRKLETKSASESFISGTRDTLLTKLGFDKSLPQSPARGSSAPTIHVHASSLREARSLLDSLGRVEEGEIVNPEARPAADIQSSQQSTFIQTLTGSHETLSETAPSQTREVANV